MKEKYMMALVELTELLYPMNIKALKHKVNYYWWVVEFFDPDCQDEIHRICKENNLEWEVKPAPTKVTNGSKPSTGNILNDIRYKRKPLKKGVLPKEKAGAKIIVRVIHPPRYRRIWK